MITLFAKASLTGLDPSPGIGVTQAHLHCGLTGTNGNVVAILLDVAPVPGPGGKDFDGQAARGEVRFYDESDPDPCGLGFPIYNPATLYEAILQRQIYLNIHSESHPSTRAQIFPPIYSPAR